MRTGERRQRGDDAEEILLRHLHVRRVVGDKLLWFNGNVHVDLLKSADVLDRVAPQIAHRTHHPRRACEKVKTCGGVWRQV